MKQPITPATLAWEILDLGKLDYQVISMARDRAACGQRTSLSRVGDYLYWLETEVDIQETQAEAFPDEAPRRNTFAATLREIADMLHDLGIEPVNPAYLDEDPDVPAMQTPVCSLEKKYHPARSVPKL